MECIKTKVLVVGGGPSGSCCAIALQKMGIDCCVVDKAMFPRMKLCAGLFTGKSQACLRNLLDDDVYRHVMEESVMSKETRFVLWNGMDKMVDCMPYDSITLVDRCAFDSCLMEHYKAVGGLSYEGVGVKDIDFEHKQAVLADGLRIQYDYLVAADGANSMVERLLASDGQAPDFVRKKASALCLEVNVERGDLDMEGVNIFFDIVPDSYAWVFSKGTKVCVGLVKLPGQDFDVNAVMLDFMCRLGVRNMDKYPLRGAMLPFGNVMAKPAWESVLFVGDAGGFVEPLTGEGIYYAMQSGVYAAESIAAAADSESGKEAGREYRKKSMYLVRLIRKGGQYQRWLEKRWTRNFFFRHASRNARFISHFYSTQIDDACLDSFARIVYKYKRNF
ncbi:MAG: geranylgeranyl reductase family protein [Bacteroides sp.]|nr:geranylgeranyl reductase family protein [Roseburia sp.]MCM1347079.1 geranylgeranyl reductase family protein [Bacteroides sp.]MCM1420538.1 geranylgeranyl reductase family protein [Bacteroides sp.]